MLKTIAKIILLAFLTFFLRDYLRVILPIPTESMIDGLLDLSKENDRHVFNILRFIFWMVFLGLFIKYAGPLFSFLHPKAKRYATTKPMRRFQGIVAELFLFGLTFLLIGLIITVAPAYRTYTKTIDDYETQLKDSIARKKKWKRANSYIREQEEKERRQFQASQEKVIPIWETDKQEIDTRNNDSKQDINSKSGWVGNTINIDSLNLVQQEKENTYCRAVAEIKIWEKYNSPSDLFFTKFKSLKWLIFIIALVLYALTHFFNRAILGRRFEKIIRLFEQGRFGLGGSARFAGLFEEWASLYKNQKNSLFMGRSLYNPFLYVGLEDDRHMMTIAGSRAGKGTTAIIPNLLLWKGSTLVIDPKGTNAAVTARRRRRMGQEVHLIDPFNVLELNQTASFNPLGTLNPDAPNIREKINIIAEAIVVPDENQKERHWDDGARTVIAGMIAHLISSPKYERPNLTMLRDMISAKPEEQVELWADMSLNDGAGRLAKDAANRIIRGIGTNEISSILSNADKHTEWLSSPAIKQALSSSSFQFADMKDKPTTIYLILPPQYLETHNRFLRLFINLSISQMSVGGRSKVPVLLMMDEFLALGKMNEVEKAFGLMAGYNLTMWPFVQDLGRLKALYGNSMNAFIANSRAVQVFGVADEESKEFVSKYIGERFTSADLKTVTTRNINLRNPDEVAKDVAAYTGIQYILRAGKAPLILEKVAYFNSVPIAGLEEVKLLGQKRLGIFHGLYDTDPDYAKN